MKNRFTTLDIQVAVAELRELLLNLRVNNVYDCNNKTYLIKFQKPDLKHMLLIESGIRLHTTTFDWPKHPVPNGFSMKLRKHVRGKRLTNLIQLGGDRVVCATFGEDELTYHLIVELYDRGNMILTDHTYKILHLLRFFSPEDDDVNLRTGELYPIEKFSIKGVRHTPTETPEAFNELLVNQPQDNIMKILNSRLDLGGNAIEHALFDIGLKTPRGIKCQDVLDRSDEIFAAFQNLKLDADNKSPCIVQVHTAQTDIEGISTVMETFTDFYSHKFSYLATEECKKGERRVLERATFNEAADEYFSFAKQYKDNQASRNVEKQAVKKLENAKRNHEKQVDKFRVDQTENRIKAELVEQNIELVEKALLIVNSMVANKLDWLEIEQLLNEAKAKHDPVAIAIKALKLEHNKITMLLTSRKDERQSDSDSLGLSSSDDSDSDQNITSANKSQQKSNVTSRKIDLDLALTTYANISAMHTCKKTAARKEEKTTNAGEKALKSAAVKAKNLIKETEKIQQIRKSRKVFWFEKYLWFITSENYLVIAGRDAIQNEQIVKRYLRPGDAYLHADIHGAASVVLKNRSKTKQLPPKSLEEAGNFALICSSAWDAKIVSEVYWVEAYQVSKTAQSGEYLTTGAFMIRGKKNYLPSSTQNLTIGYGFLFKLEGDSLERHKNERCVHESVKLQNLEGVVEESAKTPPDIDSDELILSGESDGEKEESGAPSVADGDAGSEVTGGEIDDEGALSRNASEHRSGNENIECSSGIKRVEIEFPETGLAVPDTILDSKSNKSRKERRKNQDSKHKQPQPKQNQSEADSSDSEENKPHGKKPRALPAWKQEQREASKRKNDTQIRGKKGKNKKIKQKYGNQDEEERDAIMQMLKSDGTKKVKHSRGRRSNKKADAGSRPAKTKLAKQLVERGLEKNDSRPPINTVAEPDVIIDFAELGELTSLPHGEDTLLFAIPTVAPYNVLAKYKFRAKLQPGTAKKGKTAKSILDSFLRSNDTSQLEKDLLKAVTHDDLFKNLPGKVKLVNTGKK